MPLRGFCARADLLLAIARGPGEGAAMATLLGYALNEFKPESQGGDPSSIASPPQQETSVVKPPQVVQNDLIAAQFWVPNRLQVRKETKSVAPPAESISLAPLATTPPTSIPLARWRDLRNRLQPRLAMRSPGREIDTEAMVSWLSHGRQIERIPCLMRHRRRKLLYVLVDRSEHLVPYWTDQEDLLSRLIMDSVPGSLLIRPIHETLPPPWLDSSGERLPLPGSLVLVLGDLGCLRGPDRSGERRWVAYARRLRQGGITPLALLPCASWRCPDAVRSAWNVLPWERTRLVKSTVASKEARAPVDQLLPLLASAIRLEPGLVRAQRHTLPVGRGDAGLEADVWQHPAIVSTHCDAASWDPKQLNEWRARFDALDAATRERALTLQKDWRSHLSREIWFEELVSLSSESRRLPAVRDDAATAEQFYVQLSAQVRSGRAPAFGTTARRWYSRVRRRLSDQAYSGRVAEALHRLTLHWDPDDPDSRHKPGYDPIYRHGESGLERIVLLSQEGERLLTAGFESSPGTGSPIAIMRSGNGEIRISVGNAKCEAFWEGGEPPGWADDWGRDEFGAWVEFSVPRIDGNRVTQRMRWIDSGSFMMGSPEDEPERSDSEGPQHEVAIHDGFWLFGTACTQALWTAVMGDDPSHFKGPDRPVERVSWNDARRFITEINARLPGLSLSLPSEAHWEYACRAGTDTPFGFAETAVLLDGDGFALSTEDGFLLAVDDPITPERINYNGNYPYPGGMKGEYREETLPVQALAPNGWGLYQMHGNVWEWTQDHWHDNYAGAPSDGSAWTDASVSSDAGRVVRGGCWASSAGSCRSAFRLRNRPDNRSNILGFRPVRAKGRELEPAQPRGRSVVAGSDGPEGGGLGSEQATEPQALVLRLDAHHEASAPLSKAARLEIRTDREVLTLRRAYKPGWASAMGRDRFGLWADLRIESSRGEPVIQRLRWIPPGRFEMGSPKDEPGRFESEGPRHAVVIERGYWLFETPCTQALWEAVMGKNPSRFTTSDRPVERVSWSDAQDFLERLNERFEKNSEDEFGQQAFALPSEAQWEYACRVGTETALYTGPIEIHGDMDAPALDAIAWYGGNCGLDLDLDQGEDTTNGWWKGKQKQYNHRHGGTRRVKQKQPNPWGLYDMLGNVWEWTQDHWHGRYDGARADGTPWIDANAAAGASRVIRGGSWYDFARYCRSACRSRSHPADRYYYLGFRPARVQVS